jgi:ferric-dicitrate binding protein FerR (iron transport regulator)
MSLTDKDILELAGLCSAVVDETLTDKQHGQLTHWLAASDEARQFYVRAMALSASLFTYAAEMQTEHPDAGRGSAGGMKFLGRFKWIASFVAIAACVAIAVWVGRDWKRSRQTISQAAPTMPVVDTDLYVARLTNWQDCTWADSNSAVRLYDRLRKGQRIEVAAGFAEITFDSGAQIVLQGPASLDVNSAWSTTLNRGKLKASIPPEAMGFSILNPTVEVVDIGTEFTMFTDASGAATDVLVLKGEVEAAPHASVDQHIVLRERESRRFTNSGVPQMSDGEQQALAKLAKTAPMEHVTPPTAFARWSFDEADGDTFAAEVSRLLVGTFDVHLENLVISPLPAVHVEGRWNNALRFDGLLYAHGMFPGLSNYSAHTVAFWVKVASDASYLNAYSMLSWGVNNPQLGSHPFHICWNRNPGEGTFGALRTDYGHGFAIGSTSLRDDRWHHVAIVLIPRNDPEAPMEVKQYIDGRLEGQGKPDVSRSDIWDYSPDKTVPTADNRFWLGSRLGQSDVRTNRFAGEIDELFIADRALEPQEIQRLHESNQLPQPVSPTPSTAK